MAIDYAIARMNQLLCHVLYMMTDWQN